MSGSTAAFGGNGPVAAPALGSGAWVAPQRDHDLRLSPEGLQQQQKEMLPPKTRVFFSQLQERDECGVGTEAGVNSRGL